MTDSPKGSTPNTKILSYEEIAGRMRTGDVLLFHGSSRESRAIEKITGSRYSHVAMVIRPDVKKEPWIWQAGPSPLVKDPKTRTKHGGAQLGLMRDALDFMENPAYDDTGYWRRMMVRRPASFETSAIEAVAEFEGRPFPSMMKMIENWVEGQMHIVSPEKTLFCAELVAITMMRMGLLPLSPPANKYSPASFSDEKPVEFLLDARLAPAVEMLRPAPVPRSRAASGTKFSN